MDYVEEARDGQRLGHERRVKELAKAEHFSAQIVIGGVVTDALSVEEMNRLNWKIDLVVEEAARMAAGMLKGVLKYTEDPLADDYWQQHEDDEAADVANYRILRRHARRTKDAEIKAQALVEARKQLEAEGY